MSNIIAIIAAMSEEVEAVKKIMTNIEEKRIYGLSIYRGKVNNSECVLAECGIGKVNAARVAQILISNFSPVYFINIGAAGAMSMLVVSLAFQRASYKKVLVTVKK